MGNDELFGERHEQEENGLFGKRHLADVSISTSSVDCPECKKKGCGFCNGMGLIHFYPSPDVYDYIEIARREWRISQRH